MEYIDEGYSHLPVGDGYEKQVKNDFCAGLKQVENNAILSQVARNAVVCCER